MELSCHAVLPLSVLAAISQGPCWGIRPVPVKRRKIAASIHCHSQLKQARSTICLLQRLSSELLPDC